MSTAAIEAAMEAARARANASDTPGGGGETYYAGLCGGNGDKPRHPGGRPRAPAPVKGICVSMSQESVAQARLLGGGQLSIGVRKALERAFRAHVKRLGRLGRKESGQ